MNESWLFDDLSPLRVGARVKTWSSAGIEVIRVRIAQLASVFQSKGKTGERP